MTGKSMPGTNSRTILRSQALMIGTATADADGTIRVYINGHKYGDPEPRRAVYDGVAYKKVK